MAHLTDGTTVDEDDWNALDDRVTNLEDNAVTTGGTEGDASLDANVIWNETSGTTTSTGSLTVTHGLGATPSAVLVQMRGNPSDSGPYATYVSTLTSTTFIVFFRKLSDGTAAASGQSVVIDWVAFK